MPRTRWERLLSAPATRGVGVRVEGLEGRRLLAGDVVGAVLNDMRFVSADMGVTQLAGWTVYVDGDRDGVRDAGEASAVTDLDGAYRIGGVPDGKALVRVEKPSGGWAAADAAGTWREVSVTPGGAAAAVFAMRMVEPTVVDLLVAYSPAARDQAGGTAAVREDIAQHVRDANRVFANSDTNVLVRAVGVEEVAYTEGPTLGTDLSRVQGVGDGQLDEVHGMRDRAGADLVVLYVRRASAVGEIGLGYVYTASSGPTHGFSVVTHEDGSLPAEQKYYALAHEVAHGMGAGHDPASGVTPGSLPWARGIRVTNGAGTFKDIMAYGTGLVLPVLSKPGFVWRGAVMGDRATADNARVVREAAPTVSGFRAGPPVPVVAPPVESEPPPVTPPVVEPPPVPPVVEPPVVGPPPEPPVTEPPVVTPPVVEPPVVTPPVVTPPAPEPTGIDLAIGAVGAPKAARAGVSAVLSARVLNQGTKAFQEKVRIEWFLSRDKVWDEGDVLVKRVVKTGLKVGAKKGVGVSATGAVPKDVAGGKWYVLARVDGNGIVAEDNEGNNAKARNEAVTVTGRAAKKKQRLMKWLRGAE